VVWTTFKVGVLFALGLVAGGCGFFAREEAPVDFWQPVLDPQEQRLAYIAKGDKTYALFVLNLAEGTERLLVQMDRDIVYPSWSPDGDKLAFMGIQEKDNWDIFVVEVATRSLFRVTTDPAVDANPSWTASGSIVFNSNRGGRWAAFLVNPDGTGLRRLSFDRSTKP